MMIIVLMNLLSVLKDRSVSTVFNIKFMWKQSTLEVSKTQQKIIDPSELENEKSS